jgi:cytosine/adenosine deaminase-related metal-dependent hydrolase
MSKLCRSSGAVFQTHVNEHLAAVERALERRGRRPLEGLFEDAILGPQCLMAHVRLLTPTKITMLRDSDTAVSYNPVASSFPGT